MIPIRLGLNGDAPATILTAINSGADDCVYQLTVGEWSQDASGVDQIKPTRDVLANPAIFTVKAGSQQLIRLGLRTTATDGERSYRVIVQELPRPDQPSKGMTTLLRVSIPLFVPAQKPVTAVSWALRPGPDGAVLMARNNGSVHVQIVNVQITAPGATAVPPPFKTSLYLLPGVARAVKVGGGQALTAGATYHVRIDTDQGTMSADLRADPAATAAAG